MSLSAHSRRALAALVPLAAAALLAGCRSAKFSTAMEQWRKGEYHEAQQTLKRVYRQTDPRKERERRAEVAWYLGLCGEKLMQPAQATAAFNNALRYEYPDSTLQLHLARALHMNAQYAKALEAYDAYLALCPDDAVAQSGRFGAANAARWRQDGSRYQVERFPLVSSRRAEFGAAVWGEQDETLYYTTSTDKAEGDEKSPVTGTKYFDIWMTTRAMQEGVDAASDAPALGKWQKPESAGSVNTAADEGTPCFTPDGNTMYYTGAGGGAGMPEAPQIYRSSRSDATWGAGQLVKFGGDTLTTFAHPAVSPDGRWLYFVSDMMGGQGGLDLYRASLEGGSVGFPENLGPQVNTPGNEMFPTFDPDGILYFSTDGRPGLGGLDIYSARLDDWDQWHVEHLGAPINSAGDDHGMTFMRSTREQQEGWFASNRGNGKGYDKLFRFVLPSIKVRITGTVYDTDEEPLPEAIVRVVGRNGMNFKSVTKPDGTYEVSIDRSTEYVMMSGKAGYLNRRAQFTSDPEEEDADYVVDFYLPAIDVPVLIDNIFYDYNKATLRAESYPALDDLVTLLNDNPYCAIELSAHTDRVGSQAFNLDLSQRRAQSVCDYLVSQGIDPGRLAPVGYGKERPKTVDDRLHERYGFLPEGQVLDEAFVTEQLTPEQQQVADQINRRTEFQVTTTTWGIE